MSNPDTQASTVEPGDGTELVDSRLARQVTDPADVRRRLADATRVIIRHLVSSSAPDADLEEAAAAVAQAAALLDGGTKEREYFGVAEGSLISEQREFIDYSPFMGLLNPMAPPMTIWRVASARRNRASCESGFRSRLSTSRSRSLMRRGR